MQFDEVLPQHFTTLSRTPWPHVQIDHALLQLPGESKDHNKFRTTALKAAGWQHHNLVPLGKYPDEAAAAYNRLRAALGQCHTQQELLQALQG
ncbi:hypothetical protein [Chitinilyticum piscinae]|uniref:Uncharacterized protein n=1 Tax=Chitinilyticum piscinae TaxID=2866724 RepID=A0A8J7FL91_9NEIS|nr:hypothetical protein [Chitinilyticum piscinae]MBE9608311.1 hypothetical protein [Chitinilyticum piscinae]